MFKKIRHIIGLCLLINVTVQCRTLKFGSEESNPLSSTQRSPQVNPETGSSYRDGRYHFGKKQSHRIYKLLTGAERQSGIKVPEKTMHSVAGRVECKGADSEKTCTIKVHLPGNKHSEALPNNTADNKEVVDYIKIHRAELIYATTVLLDIVCDFLGPQSPPYDRKSISCKLRYPRITNEAIFDDQVAQEISSLLAGGQARTGTTEFQGSLSCQNEHVCELRSMNQGQLADQTHMLNRRFSRSIYKRLKNTLEEHSLFSGQKVEAEKVPNEIVGAVYCQEDPSREKILGKPQFTCRITL